MRVVRRDANDSKKVDALLGLQARCTICDEWMLMEPEFYTCAGVDGRENRTKSTTKEG
jgi:hypothetical protein